MAKCILYEKLNQIQPKHGSLYSRMVYLLRPLEIDLSKTFHQVELQTDMRRTSAFIYDLMHFQLHH